jgi:hypothetical protein
MLLEGAALLLGTGLVTKGVQALFSIAKAIGSYEASTAKCLEQLTKMVQDHEQRIRDLEEHSSGRRNR